MKTYTREELQKLEGKRIRTCYDYGEYKQLHEGEFFLRNNFIWMSPQKQICIKDQLHNLKIELLENEFEVGEEVEVSDDIMIQRDRGYYVTTLPEDCNSRYVVKDIYENKTPYIYQHIRKQQPQILEQTMEEVNKKYGCTVKIVDKKL